jgi:uncharacterized protein YbjQ (UPF0145 family)
METDPTGVGDIIVLFLQIALPLVLLLLGLVIGNTAERRHFARLQHKENELSNIAVSDLNTIPENWSVTQSFLVTGAVVIANDYFKTFVSSIRNLFGGRMRAYEALVERGRREAIVRMLEEARRHSANAVWNVRIETSTMQGKSANRAGGIELVAYGTALCVE